MRGTATRSRFFGLADRNSNALFTSDVRQEQDQKRPCHTSRILGEFLTVPLVSRFTRTHIRAMVNADREFDVHEDATMTRVSGAVNGHRQCRAIHPYNSCIEAQGGRVWVSSHAARGAVFQCSLPALGGSDLTKPARRQSAS